MARPRKHDTPPRREPPVQFRMEGDLGRLVRGFADGHGLGVNEAAKSLIALAVVALDGRYYGLVRQLADALGGSHAFIQACLRVNASLEGAAMATGSPFVPEADRPAFVLRVVEGVLTGRGLAVKSDGVWFLPGASGTPSESPTSADSLAPVVGSTDSGGTSNPSRKKKRTIRRMPAG